VANSDDTLAGFLAPVSGAGNRRQKQAPVSGQCVMAFRRVL